MAETVGYLILAPLLAEATAFGTISVVSATAATVVGSAALIGASVAASYALNAAFAPSAPSLPKPSDGTTPLKQAIPPRVFGYGRVRVAGSYMLFEAPKYGDPLDEYSYDVLALHHGEIEGFVHYFLNEDLVWLDENGYVVRHANDDERRYDTDDDAESVRIDTRVGGVPETAYSQVTAAMPAIWTSAHRGDGLASLMMICRAGGNLNNYPKTFPRGLPKPSIVADLSAVYDPRDIDQARASPFTWTLSTNPVLQLIDYLTHDERGPGLDWDEFIQPQLDALMAEADICDELVTKADGSTEKRYESNGWAYFTSDPSDVISSILATCDGWLAEAGDGTLALTVGKYRAPSVILTDDHIVGFSMEKGVADEEVVNELRWSYIAPGNDYREAPGDAWQDAASIAELGRIRSQNMSLQWVQSHSQGRRLVKRAMARHQASVRGTITANLYGLQALGRRWVKVRSRLIDDLSDAVVEITRARIEITQGRVVLDWVLVNPNAIDAWDAETEAGSEPRFDSQLTPMPRDLVVSANGSAIHVVIDQPPPLSELRDDLSYVVEWRLSVSSGAWTRQEFGPDDVTDAGDTLEMDTSAVASGTYHVRVATRGAGAGDALSAWTTVASVAI